ncbi:MAG: glycosyltransferase [Gemmatimonadota bacterium]|nr:glycosyltransferase [Gemmatimonadota bacterium]
MKLVIFGLSISSSWGNGHATLWRGLAASLAQRGHRIVFFERDVPYYAAHRDLTAVPGGELVLYPDWHAVQERARRELADADVALATSYCPDALAAEQLMHDVQPPLRVFYDLDTPVTLARLERGEDVPYIGTDGLAGYDLVLSYTGGGALTQLRERLGARRVSPLYGSVDPGLHRPTAPEKAFRAHVSYLGTYAADRQDALDRLFIQPAERMPDQRFLIGGAQYPHDFPWSRNIWFVQHVQPADHPAFYCSSRLTLNVTREPMAAMGWCPSGRLFEAAACGVPVVSDWWPGLDEFFAPGEEIIVAHDTADAIAAYSLPADHLAAVGRAARERALHDHTAERRAVQLEAALDAAMQPAEAAGH